MEVLKFAIELVVETDQETKQIPKEELYGLTSQIRRSAILIPSNIAEDSSRLERVKNRRKMLIGLIEPLENKNRFD